MEHLFPCELRVVRAIMDGKLNKEAAYQLGLAEGTVKCYLRRIYQKLGFSGGGSKVKLALWAREHAELLNAQ